MSQMTTRLLLKLIEIKLAEYKGVLAIKLNY